MCSHSVFPQCVSTVCFPQCVFHSVYPQCVSTVCIHSVFPQCVSTVCFHSVYPQCGSTVYFHSVYPQCVSTVCIHRRQHRDNTETTPRQNRDKTQSKIRAAAEAAVHSEPRICPASIRHLSVTQATRSHTHTPLFREFPVWDPFPQTPIYGFLLLHVFTKSCYIPL